VIHVGPSAGCDHALRVLAQTNRAPIRYLDGAFGSVAHLLGFQRARHIGDLICQARIRAAASPKDVLAAELLTRRDPVLEKEWDRVLPRELLFALRLKFEQHRDLVEQLIGTGEALLCYAAPDLVLGTGVADTHRYACSPRWWPGRNLLGIALTVVRSELRFVGGDREQQCA